MAIDLVAAPPLVVTLGGTSHPVTLPKRHAERRDLATTWVRSNSRGSAAILATCVPALGIARSPGNPGGLDPSMFGYDWFEFGAEALELLLAKGYDEIELLRESVPVFNAIAALLPVTGKEVAAARDFSKATGAH